jgi:hypothetical protein
MSHVKPKSIWHIWNCSEVKSLLTIVLTSILKLSQLECSYGDGIELDITHLELDNAVVNRNY